MDDKEIDPGKKSRLYQAAIRVKELAPWEWMTETDIFGVQNPETEEIGFVSVMGMLGEHYSVAVYLGTKGLDGLWSLLNGGDIEMEDFFEVPQLQASFENRETLTPKDLDEIKKLGLRFRGKQAWPVFRSFRPGYFPWYLEKGEVEFLTLALEQLLEVAPRSSPELLMPEDELMYLVRVGTKKDEEIVWEDRIMEIPEDELAEIPIEMEIESLEKLQGLPQKNIILEIDFYLFPAKFGSKEERPRCAYMLMVVERGKGLVLGSEMLKPKPTLETMYGMVPLTIVNLLAKLGFVPKEVRVRTQLLHQLLETLEEPLNFEVKKMSVLPALDSAKNFLMQRFMERG